MNSRDVAYPHCLIVGCSSISLCLFWLRLAFIEEGDIQLLGVLARLQFARIPVGEQPAVRARRPAELVRDVRRKRRHGRRGLEAIDRGTIEALRCDGASLQVVHLRRRRRAPREGGTWRTRLSFPGAGEDPTRLRTSASSESVRATGHATRAVTASAPASGGSSAVCALSARSLQDAFRKVSCTLKPIALHHSFARGSRIAALFWAQPRCVLKLGTAPAIRSLGSRGRSLSCSERSSSRRVSNQKVSLAIRHTSTQAQ